MEYKEHFQGKRNLIHIDILLMKWTIVDFVEIPTWGIKDSVCLEQVARRYPKTLASNTSWSQCKHNKLTVVWM